MTPELDRRAAEAGSGEGRSPIPRRWAALLLALGALGAAVLAALGPAETERAVYTWPPAALPAASPTRSWLGPLFVARHHVDRLDAQVPCDPVSMLGGERAETILLATARDVVGWRALEVVRSPRDVVTVRVGRRALARIDASSSAGSCRLRIRVDGDGWMVEHDDEVVAHGHLPAPVGVSGLITDIDLKASPTHGLGVAVEPFPQDTHPSSRQTLLRCLAAVLLIAAAVSLGALASARLRLLRPGRPKAQDWTVLGVIGVWWLLSPLFYDDGWVRARETNALSSGGFSSYYEHWGTNLPLATWLEWLQQLVVAHTTSLAAHRAPAALALIATWVLCRACLTRLLQRLPTLNDVAWWSATSAFCLGVVAFGMTLRPEPVVALLTVGVLAAALRYATAPSPAPLVVAMLLIGLAVTAHPAGLVSAAPVLVCIPRIWRDLRAQKLPVVSLAATVLVGVAWTTLLVFLDSDVGTRTADAERIREVAAHSAGVLQELQRYANLSGDGGAVVRREFAVLLLLTPIALLVGLRHRRELTELIPTAALGLSLLILATTPSKWIWHFGGLTGLAAVAIGVESSRLADRSVPQIARLVTGSTIVLAAAWAASDPWPWGPLDVVTVSWTDRPRSFTLGVAAGSTAVLALWRMGRLRRPELALLTGTVGALIAATLVALTADAAATTGWTAPRQALGSLVGRDGCGVADGLVIPAASSVRALERVGRARERASTVAAVQSPASRSAPTWYRIPAGPIGMFVDLDDRHRDELVASWGRVAADGVQRLSTGAVVMPSRDAGTGRSGWAFVANASFPQRPHGADAVLIHARGRPGQPLSQPVAYHAEPMARALLESGTHALVDPFLFEATPCARPPVLRYGVAQTPSLLFEWHWGPSHDALTSPFLATGDLFWVVRVPIEDWAGDRQQVRVEWALVDPRDAIASPARRVLAS